MRAQIEAELRAHIEVANDTLTTLIPAIDDATNLLVGALLAGKKVLLCGNGGSAADAQHIAAELIGRYQTERCPYPALSLATDTSALTAISNDYGYDEVFSRQVAALCCEGDVVIGISTSGNSRSIAAALTTARARGGKCIGLLGKEGGICRELCDVAIVVPSANTARIQEMHITIGHTMCAGVDTATPMD